MHSVIRMHASSMIYCSAPAPWSSCAVCLITFCLAALCASGTSAFSPNTKRSALLTSGAPVFHLLGWTGDLSLSAQQQRVSLELRMAVSSLPCALCGSVRICQPYNCIPDAALSTVHKVLSARTFHTPPCAAWRTSQKCVSTGFKPCSVPLVTRFLSSSKEID